MKNPTTRTAARGAWTCNAHPKEVAAIRNILMISISEVIISLRLCRANSQGERDHTPQSGPFDLEYLALLSEIATYSIFFFMVDPIHLETIQVTGEYRSESRGSENSTVRDDSHGLEMRQEEGVIRSSEGCSQVT